MSTSGGDKYSDRDAAVDITAAVAFTVAAETPAVTIAGTETAWRREGLP